MVVDSILQFMSQMDETVLALMDDYDDFYMIMKNNRGIHPIDLQKSIKRLYRSNKIRKSKYIRIMASASNTNIHGFEDMPDVLPVPHILDYDWRFSRQGLEYMANAVKKIIKKKNAVIVFLGAPTLFRYCYNKSFLHTDKIEPYGIDEGWLDVTESSIIKGDGMKIAQEISDRIKYELGITVSIGISWNKIFAKLGSDYKKPDAITQFHRGNYKEIVWGLPVSDLLYVGRQTNKKLQKLGIHTIGQLAQTDEKLLDSHFGKSVWCYGHLQMDMTRIRFVRKDMKLRSSRLETVQRHRETWKRIWMCGLF